MFIDLENTRQGPRGRTVFVYERQGDTKEVHQISEEHVLSVRNCTELSFRNKRTLCSGSWPPPRIYVSCLPSYLYMYAFHLRPRGSNGTLAVRLIVVVWPVRSMHRAAVLVLLAGETSLSGSP